MYSKDKTKRIRLVIADDHELMRTGLVALLERYPDRFEVVGQASTGYQAFTLCQQTRPDILVLDLHMPGDWDGFKVVEEIKAENRNIRVLVLTMDNRAEKAVVRDYGADKCLLKDTSNQVILESLELLAISPPTPQPPAHQSVGLKRAVSFGQEAVFNNNRPTYTPDHIIDEDDLLGQIELEKYKLLTARETAVLAAAASGLKPEEIAVKLMMSKGTVSVHLSSIYKKLGVRGLPQAISFAFRNHLAEPNGRKSTALAATDNFNAR